MKLIRFLADQAAASGVTPVEGLAAAVAYDAIELDGLPAPRFSSVQELTFADGAAAEGFADKIGPGGVVLLAEAEVRRGPVPEGAPFVMMSVARRNRALTRDEQAERWRAEAGNLGAETIPDDVRGLAYVQLHPVGDDPPYDAINQVLFDDLEAMRRRAAWFAARPVPPDLWDPASSFALHLRRRSS